MAADHRRDAARASRSEHGKEDKGVRRVAVHHGGNHVHVVATLARMDGRPVSIYRDWNRVQEAMSWAEREYGLTPVAPAGPRGTAERRATRAEAEKAGRLKEAGRIEWAVPARTRLRRLVEAAAAASSTEAEFFAALAARRVTVKPPSRPGLARVRTRGQGFAAKNALA